MKLLRLPFQLLQIGWYVGRVGLSAGAFVLDGVLDEFEELVTGRPDRKEDAL